MVTPSASAAPLKPDSDHKEPFPELQVEPVPVAELARPPRAVRKRSKRLMVNVPPRTLKSMIISIAWPAFLLGHNPSLQIMVVSHSLELATDLSNRFRQIMDSTWYKATFPTMSGAPLKDNERIFVTSEGGKRMAVSVNGSVTGMGADLIIMDDPLDASQVATEAICEKTNHWIDTVLSTRLNDPAHGAMVLLMQRMTNPLYAGRIRHRNEVYEGKHPAIIDPAEWEAVQMKLSDRSARSRRGRGRGRPDAKVSLLAGKIFDETGDRLTPTHSKTRNGKRLRYYVSRRLIRRSGERDLSGWRLPAPQLESAVAELVRQKLNEPRFPATLLPEADAGLLKDVSLRLSTIRNTEALAAIVDRIDIAPGAITIVARASGLAELLELDAGSLPLSEAPTITAPFRTRRRGVETKLILGDAPQETDQRLLENIARANDWFEQLKAGRTYAEIAQSAGTSRRRVQQMTDLAFLAPDIVRAIAEGRQPVGLTSD